MSRYIDADDAANAIYHHFPSIRTMADARSIIEEAPSIDIVRCQECQGYTPNTKPQTDEHLQRLQMCVDCEHTDMCEWCSRWSKDESQTERR